MSELISPIPRIFKRRYYV